MTLAGTRPPTVDEWDKYELHHRARLATKPGLTGMWQVSGRSNITDLINGLEIIKQLDRNDGQFTSINAESYASMNMWGLTPKFMQTLEDGFKEFFANMGDKDILKAEYLLPIYIDELLQAGRVSVKVLDTNDKWFGVTYKEDKDYVVKSFAKLIESGVYQKNLFKDLK